MEGRTRKDAEALKINQNYGEFEIDSQSVIHLFLNWYKRMIVIGTIGLFLVHYHVDKNCTVYYVGSNSQFKGYLNSHLQRNDSR